jgi:hypothetical protein
MEHQENHDQGRSPRSLVLAGGASAATGVALWLASDGDLMPPAWALWSGLTIMFFGAAYSWWRSRRPHGRDELERTSSHDEAPRPRGVDVHIRWW